MKERNKPTKSFIARSKYEIENADRLLEERIEKVKEIRVNKLLYQDSEAFKVGYEAGKQEMIEKACEWLYVYYPTLERAKSFEDAWEHFKKAMEE